MRNVTKIFKALSDRNRVRILKMLEIRPLCVCEMTVVLKISTSTVSKHLSLLREAGFIEDQKDGKWVEYKLKRNSDNAQVKELLSSLSKLLNDDAEVKTYSKRLKHIDRYKICKV